VLLSDYIADVQEILHDSTASVWPLQRVISRINDARIDVARDMHCIRKNVVGIQLIPGKEIYDMTGAVAGATVTAGGSNYTGATVPVTFSAAPAGGVTALGTGNITSGALTSITMTQWGSGYTSIPVITIGGAGSGASAAAVALFQSNPLSTNIGQPITPNKISFIWNGERRTLKYASFMLFDAYARMWVQNFNAPPGIWTHHQQEQLVYIQPPPDQLYLSEWDIIFLPAPLVANSDVDTQIKEPWGRALQFRAASYLLEKLRNSSQVIEMERRYSDMVPHIITTSSGIRIPNIYNRSFQRRIMR
jgi:hypothetical protein